MTTFRTDGEVLRIMGKCVDFVSELIDYIAEYPDDDYMTMECLCRKLVKYDLIDKKDGYYLVDKGVKVAEQTEPQKPSDDDETIQAIAHLQKVRWLQEHDKALTEPQTDVYEYQNGEWVKPDCPWK